MIAADLLHGHSPPGAGDSLLRNARGLRHAELDAGMVAAQIGNTNKLYEGVQSGDFGQWYPGYSWEAEIHEAATNGLFQVDIVVLRRGLAKPVDAMSIFLFRPDSPKRDAMSRPQSPPPPRPARAPRRRPPGAGPLRSSRS